VNPLRDLTMKRVIKLLFVGVSSVVLLALLVAGYFSLLLGEQPLADPATTAAQLDLMRNALPAQRGRILAVVTSTATIPGTQKKAGYELTELARAYWVFRANGYAVDIASPRGGAAPMRLDDELVEADYAFLNDADAQAKISDTLPLASIDPSRYAAVYFVGGKGTLFDFPDDPHIPALVRAIARDGVVGAVCHGPAALLGVTRDDGTPFVRGRRMTGFTNAEELFLIENARVLFPFLLEDRARSLGARFDEGTLYLDNTVVDGRLVTGQNPWSTWSVAEAMIRALGHEPVARATTREELGVRVLDAYATRGWAAAHDVRNAQPRGDTRLILLHALIATMEWRLGDAVALVSIAGG